MTGFDLDTELEAVLAPTPARVAAGSAAADPGWDWPLVEAAPLPPPEEVHAEAMARGARCRECPLWDCKTGPVVGEIRSHARLTVIAEAPGKHEIPAKRPLHGPTGRIIDACLEEGGTPRDQATLTNVVCCKPPGDGNYAEYVEGLEFAHKRAVRAWVKTWAPADPAEPRVKAGSAKAKAAAEKERGERARALWTAAGSPAESAPPAPLLLPAEACRPRLEWELAQAPNAKVILAVGRAALEELTPILGCVSTKEGKKAGDDRPRVAPMRQQHGAPVPLAGARAGQVLLASYHPAMAMPGRDKREMMPVIKENVARAARIAARGGYIDWSWPDIMINPSKGLIISTTKRFIEARGQLTIDIETDGLEFTSKIRRVGLGMVIDHQEVVIVVPFRFKQDDTYWWSREDTIEIALWLRAAIEACPLLFHNGVFDTVRLFLTRILTSRLKEWDDTLLLHHDTQDNDLPHDLGFVLRRLYEAPIWKENIDHKAGTSSTTSEDEYSTYCGKDVTATMRIAPRLFEWVERDYTAPQYQVDRHLARITRDMGMLGLPVDEQRRGMLSRKMNTIVRDLRRKFQAKVGAPVNPRSVPQLQELLYVDWGLTPALGTDGYEWEDGEDGSTGNGALTLLLDRGLQAHQSEAIDILMELRAVDKSRGMVDNLPVYDEWSDDIGWEDAVRAEVYVPDLDDDVVKEVIPRRHALTQLHPNYKLNVPTGRIASDDPNVQNWQKRGRLVDCYACGGTDTSCPVCSLYFWHADPEDPNQSGWIEVKPNKKTKLLPVIPAGAPMRRLAQLNQRTMIVAPPGHVLVGADYAQIELRLYAMASGDKLVLWALQNGLDPHTLNAATLLAESRSDIMAKYRWIENSSSDIREYWRTVAKRFAFLEIYGGEEGKLFSVMFGDRDKVTGKRTFPKLKAKDVEQWHENWHKYHPETRQWHAVCHQGEQEYGYVGVCDLDLRKRYFPGGPSKKNAVPNMTIQGRAASICNRGLMRLDEAIPHRGWSRHSGVCIQVHDYLGVFVPEGRVDEAKKLIRECMEYSEPGMKYLVDVKAGHRLSEV